jgi:hypothetical protein
MALGGIGIAPILLFYAFFYGFVLWVIYKIVVTLSKIATSIEAIKVILQNSMERPGGPPAQ